MSIDVDLWLCLKIRVKYVKGEGLAV